MPEQSHGTEQKLVLLTGATGYVGGRLLRILEEKGVRVCCLTRHPEFVHPRLRQTEVCRGDVLEPETLPSAMSRVDTAYYLIHWKNRFLRRPHGSLHRSGPFSI